MKSIVLVGDSIRLGYQATVVQELHGVANIWSPEENGGHSANILNHLQSWVLDRQPDILHINCGFHDLKTIFKGGRTSVVPLNHYRENLKTIFRTVHERTKSKILWATTTPLNEKNHSALKNFDRYEADVTAYNQAALEVTSSLGLPVNDLHSLVMREGRDHLLLPDGVHYTPEGYTFLGKAVAGFLKQHLS